MSSICFEDLFECKYLLTYIFFFTVCVFFGCIFFVGMVCVWEEGEGGICFSVQHTLVLLVHSQSQVSDQIVVNDSDDIVTWYFFSKYNFQLFFCSDQFGYNLVLYTKIVLLLYHCSLEKMF